MTPSHAASPHCLSISEVGTRAVRVLDVLARHLLKTLARFMTRRALRKAEEHLLGLDDHILRDIGIDRREMQAAFGELPRDLRSASMLGPAYGVLDPFR